MSPQNPERRIRHRPTAPQLRPEYGMDWAVSFKYLDLESSWLTKSGDVPHQLLFWLMNLARSRDHGQLLDYMLPEHGSPIHHSISYDSLTLIGQNRIAELSDREEYVGLGLDDLFSLRYCHKYNSPERLIGVFRSLIFYPIWWDPKHEYSGSPKDRALSGNCKQLNCLHLIDY
jgi:hypothetical protein